MPSKSVRQVEVYGGGLEQEEYDMCGDIIDVSPFLFDLFDTVTELTPVAEYLDMGGRESQAQHQKQAARVLAHRFRHCLLNRFFSHLL